MFVFRCHSIYCQCSNISISSKYTIHIYICILLVNFILNTWRSLTYDVFVQVKYFYTYKHNRWFTNACSCELFTCIECSVLQHCIYVVFIRVFGLTDFFSYFKSAEGLCAKENTLIWLDKYLCVAYRKRSPYNTVKALLNTAYNYCFKIPNQNDFNLYIFFLSFSFPWNNFLSYFWFCYLITLSWN